MKQVIAFALLFCVGVFGVVNLRLKHVPGLSANFVSPTKINLKGNVATMGEYYAPISVGNPPQNFWVQVDTGSSDLLIDSLNCNGCGANHNLFNISASTTASLVSCSSSQYSCPQCWKKTQCGFKDQYGDGSFAQGYVIVDTFSVGGISANTSFGLIEASSRRFEPLNVDGIWGLAYQSISDWKGAPPLFSILGQNPDIAPAFSMCLQANQATMQIGVNYTGDSSFQWTPIITPEYYVVNMTDLKVNGNSIGVSNVVWNSNDCIVDSGTTLIIFPTVAFQALNTSFLALCNTTQLAGVCGSLAGGSLFNGDCVQMSSSQRAAFPQLQFSFMGGATATIGPETYLFHQQNYICMGIVEGGQDFPTILGDTFMRGMNVAFDIGNKVVGFAPKSTCP